MDRKYTIRDIARLAGVSFKTVSRVINNEDTVKPSTRDKVMRVIAETNYKPNLYARNLSTKTSRNILISIRKTQGQNTTEWVDLLMSYLITAASARGFTIIQEIFYEDSELANSILEGAGGYVDLLVLFYLEDDDKRIELAQRYGVPFISFEKHRQVPLSVSNNNRRGVQDAVAYLFSRGLERICMLLGSPLEVNKEREQAIQELYAQHGVASAKLEVVYEMNNLAKIDQWVSRKIGQRELPQAFFVSGDEKAAAVYHALYRHGLRIPRDVSVVGFDNIPVSAYYNPPLTTVGLNYERLSNEMVNMIEKLLNKAEDLAPVEVETELIVRASVK